MSRGALGPLLPGILEKLPAPWKACRSHEDHDGPMWQIDDDEAAYYAERPLVRILAANGEVVTSAHDLFEFRDPAVAHLLAAAPLLLQALELAEEGLLSPETREVVRAALAAARGGA